MIIVFEKKLENLNVRHKINYGYNFVIKLMVVSGILSIIVLSLLFRDVRKNVVEAGGMLNSTTIVYGVGIVIIVAFVCLAIFFSKMLGAKIVQAIIEPLIAIEKVTKEIAAGNLHCEIDYNAKDKIGELAHDLRKSVSILASYVDDISNSMDEFSKGNFAVKPQVEWKGDFKGIRDSFIAFEESMSSTVKGIQQVFKLVEEAFRDMEESDHREQFLVGRLRHSPAFVPELSLVADGDGGVVGYGLMTRVSIRSGKLEAESLALAPVAVRPDRQSMGIGSALIRELHARAARLGYKSAVVLGHEGFYPRFGYRKASDYGIAFPFDVPAECCMAAELVAGGLRGTQGMVYYPEAFME